MAEHRGASSVKADSLHVHFALQIVSTFLSGSFVFKGGGQKPGVAKIRLTLHKNETVFFACLMLFPL